MDFSGRRRSCWFGFLYVFLGENQVQEEPMEVKLIDQDPVKEEPMEDAKMENPMKSISPYPSFQH